MIVWEYASMVGTLKRDDAGKDTWTVKIWIGLDTEPVFSTVFGPGEFKRLHIISGMGARGWDLCGIEGEKVTFPGQTLGLGRDNTQSGASMVRYLFKRPMQRPPSPQEREFADQLLGRSG